MTAGTGMTFGVILSIDCVKKRDIESYMPSAELLEQMDKTEGDESFEYDYLEGPWEGGHHVKLVCLIDEKDFNCLVKEMGLYADDTETEGIIGAPWTPSGFGWAPAMNFDGEDFEAIINAYVTPFPANKKRKELTEKEWEKTRKKVLKKYGRKS